ncbi:hypothetical protein PBRA_006414 [Plasmodiophora brassicae]|uniref:Uncharacterized protein n=1 Tax=Plasmodiophora brassicae TaxID=37360 RepID=A0A0G4ISQ6_PLABS|nr:hypothetical protein PBRA_006414 [Plasmodiophora brassicae]
MAAGLLGLVVACALLTDRQSAGADTVTWKIEGSDLIVSERWSLFDVKFTRYGPGSTSELMVWRRTYHSGDAHGTYCNTTSVDSLFAYPDNGTVWTRFEFDVPPHGDPVPSDIKIDFEHNECGAKRVTVSLEYNQCEYVVYNNLPLNISKKQHEIYVKRNDVLKSIYQTSSDAKACKLRAEDKLSDERHQVTELSSTIKRLEEEASKQKHALQVMTDERDSLPAIVTSQAGLVASLTDQVTLLDGESAVLRNTSDRQASEIANLTVRGQVLDKLAAKVARLTWQVRFERDMHLPHLT